MRLIYSLVTFFIVTLNIVFTAMASSMQTEPVSPIPHRVDINPKKVTLGKRLFHDTLFSHNREISCASCHAINTYGATPGMRYSRPGVSGKVEPINIPTIFNSGFNFMQFWDGRAKDLESQIDGPIHNKNELGMTWPKIIKRINENDAYKKQFYAIYRSPPTEKTIKDAIASYEKSLITPNAPFDQFLRGDKTAISKQAQQGYLYFKKYGCASCHQGINLGGNMFQTFGIVKDYFKDRGSFTQQDLGRFNVTGEEQDKHIFRVPPLRNVAKTAPYFHDGSVETLEEAIKIMADYQLGRDLTQDEIDAIATFLRSLTAVYKEEVHD